MTKLALEPVLVTKIDVATGAGFVLISLGAPAGDMALGARGVENREVARVALTFKTLKELADLCSKVVADIEAAAAASTKVALAPAPIAEPSSFRDEPERKSDTPDTPPPLSVATKH